MSPISTHIHRDSVLLHPEARPLFQKFIGQLLDARRDRQINTHFRVFESYRSPLRQELLYAQGRGEPGNIVTNARAWQSAHNYGLAIDVVPYYTKEEAESLNINGGRAGFFWDHAPKEEWDFVHNLARSMGFEDRIPWDSPHIQHPLYNLVKETIDVWRGAYDQIPLREVPF